MKISFPKYGGELLTRKRLAPWIIAFVAIGLVAGVCGSFLLGNKWWLLAIAVLGIAGIVLCIGVAVAIFPTQSEVNEAHQRSHRRKRCRNLHRSGIIGPESQFEHGQFLDSPSAETSDGLSSDPFGINDNVWLNDNSHEGATPTFINGPPDAEEPITEALSQTTTLRWRGAHYRC